MDLRRSQCRYVRQLGCPLPAFGVPVNAGHNGEAGVTAFFPSVPVSES
jgi:hypothetical protein